MFAAAFLSQIRPVLNKRRDDFALYMLPRASHGKCEFGRIQIAPPVGESFIDFLKVKHIRLIY